MQSVMNHAARKIEVYQNHPAMPCLGAAVLRLLPGQEGFEGMGACIVYILKFLLVHLQHNLFYVVQVPGTGPCFYSFAVAKGGVGLAFVESSR